MIAPKDLVVLVADKDIEFALKGLLGRPQALGIRTVSSSVFVHPSHDPGCLLNAHEFLRSQAKTHQHGLVIFDHQGCGQELRSTADLQSEVEQRLVGAGWSEENVGAITIAPELEVWVWSDSPHVERVLGWTNGGLRQWLTSQHLLREGAAKPEDPKRAVEAALRHARTPRSSSLYRELASSVAVDRCTDASFVRLVATLRRWFGP